MSKLFSSFRSALPAAAIVCSLFGTVHRSFAQSGTTVQTPFAIGPERAESVKPYDFSGRVFDLAPDIGFGSGTLLHRHTVLTAGHVVYDPTAGFQTNVTFSRGLYGDFTISKAQVTTVQALSGYQSAVASGTTTTTTTGTTTSTPSNTTLAAFSFDQGILLLLQASVDEDWADFTFDPTLLSNPAYATFTLGYPGVSFDGRTLAYVVPGSPYVAAGASASSGLYENDNYIGEEGMSGGGVFVAIATGDQRVAGDYLGGINDTTGEFNAALVRAINKASRRFIDDAEFANGYIKRVAITNGSKIVQRGTTVQYTVVPVFTSPGASGATHVKTLRYDNIKFSSNVPSIPGAPGIHVTKLNNFTFSVAFDAGLPANSTTVLQAYYDGTNVVPGKSSITVTIK